MKTVWEYSTRTEALRILHTAKNIASGFYRLNHFIVLPPDTAKPAGNIVTFPGLPYLSIPRFWDRVSRIDITVLPTTNTYVPADLVDLTEKLIAPLIKTDFSEFSVVKKQWDRHQSLIIGSMNELIPSSKNQIKSITIWPTYFGTTCSFNVCTTPPYHIHLWLRSGSGIAEIIEAILTSLTRHIVYEKLGGLWSESELLVDWLMTQSSLAPILQSAGANLANVGTLNAIRTKQQAGLVKKSRDFLTKIGALQPDSSLIKSLDTGSFSSAEKQLFNLLVARSPRVVTFDEIHNQLHAPGDESFSLYSISKSIQRLRDRLEESGISGSFIQTKRGEGYFIGI